MVHEKLTETVIGAAMQVANTLGNGFLEKVYENSLVHELRKRGFSVVAQHPIPVYYDDVLVGDYIADIIVEGVLILELKACANLDKIHTAQCLNYLKATNLPVCLLINFGKPRLEYKRLVGASAI